MYHTTKITYRFGLMSSGYSRSMRVLFILSVYVAGSMISDAIRTNGRRRYRSTTRIRLKNRSEYQTDSTQRPTAQKVRFDRFTKQNMTDCPDFCNERDNRIDDESIGKIAIYIEMLSGHHSAILPNISTLSWNIYRLGTL